MPRIMPRKKRVKPSVRCRACGYTWTPNPNMWRNTNPINYKGYTVKVLCCPNCTTRNYLTVEDVRELLKWWIKHGKEKRSH